MKNSARLLALAAILAAPALAPVMGRADPVDPNLDKFRDFAAHIDGSAVEAMPTQSHGRVKPFDSFARETVLFLIGKYSPWGQQATQTYLGLITSGVSQDLEFINVRDPELRTQLGFSKAQRFFSVKELEQSPLERIAAPILAKEQQNEKLVTPDEKKVIEAQQQLWLAKGVISGSHLLQALDLSASGGEHAGSASVNDLTQKFLRAVATEDHATAKSTAPLLDEAARAQPMPELFKPYLSKMGLEVWYNHSHLFFFAGLLYFLFGIALLSGLWRQKLTRNRVLAAIAIPLLLHAGGFGVRVYITGFAPVTSMYGTMVWMAFGVVSFGAILFALYRHYVVYGVLLLGASATLLLSESIPLILSPDMDPIVAVLRNNFWLTIHVMTISVSYAAFTIAMLIGNFALVRNLMGETKKDVYQALSHICYRIIQLGVFLLTAGIILGGWWADYSWGRFWGWDPKETWALIADLGFIAILHARYTGWLRHFGILAASPIAYLLVIMAWYGVNFILAAGLHSYGFSSGGAMMVSGYVTAQMILFGASMAVLFMRRSAILAHAATPGRSVATPSPRGSRRPRT